MICSQCGRENHDSARSCIGCGAPIIGGVADGAKKVADTVSDGAHAAADGVKDGAHAVAGTVSDGAHAAAGAVSGGAHAVVGTVAGGAHAVVGGVKDGAGKVADGVSGGAHAIAGGVKDGTHAVVGGVESQVSKSYDQAKSAYKHNQIGMIGFILAIIAFIMSFLPTVGWPAWANIISWIIWAAGLILSFIGVFRIPRGFAIAGLIISLFGLIATVLVIVLSGLSGLVFPGTN